MITSFATERFVVSLYRVPKKFERFVDALIKFRWNDNQCFILLATCSQRMNVTLENCVQVWVKIPDIIDTLIVARFFIKNMYFK